MAEPRVFDFSLDVPAAPEEVWRALTEASELVRWFPLQAEVQPGVGGTMSWGWGEDWTWNSRIDAWEPGRRLLLTQEAARPFDVGGGEVAESTAEPARIAMEFTLEVAGGGATRLRLVHSGFGQGAAWDDELDGISHGWTFELRSLVHYLGRHAGRTRHQAAAQATTSLSPAQAWRRVVRPGGFVLEPELPVVGEGYTATGAGERFSGETLVMSPDRQLAGTARELGDGLFRIDTWRGGGRTGVIVAAASWEEKGEARVRDFTERAQRLLAELLPPA